MPVNITASFIKRIAAKPPAKPRDYRDASLTGFLVRHHPSGSLSYYAQVRRGSRRLVGKHPALDAGEARDGAKRILAASALKQLPGESRKRIRLGEFAKGDYAKWARGHLKCHELQIARLDTYWGLGGRVTQPCSLVLLPR